MQKMINVIFLIATVLIILGSAIFAFLSLDSDSDYGIGWFWGVVSGLCLWAVYHGFSSGIFTAS